MFKRKNKVYVTMSPAERRLMLTAMVSFRNKLIAANLPTEDVNTILLRMDAIFIHVFRLPYR